MLGTVVTATLVQIESRLRQMSQCTADGRQVGAMLEELNATAKRPHIEAYNHYDSAMRLLLE